MTGHRCSNVQNPIVDGKIVQTSLRSGRVSTFIGNPPSMEFIP